MHLQVVEKVERHIGVEIPALEAFVVIRANILRAMDVKPEWKLVTLAEGMWFIWQTPQEEPNKAAPATPEQIRVYTLLEDLRNVIAHLEIK